MEEPRLEKVLRKLRLRRVEKLIQYGDVLLDVGCGWEARLLLGNANKLARGFGIDFKVSAEAPISNITLHARSFTDASWPVGDQSVDKVTMLAVLEHISEIHVPFVLKEVRRVLKPNGQFILTVPTPRSKPVLEFLAFQLGIVNPDEIRDHKIYYDYKLLKRILKEHGFKIETYRTFLAGMNSFCISRLDHDSSPLLPFKEIPLRNV